VTRTESERWHVYMLRCADGTLYTGVTNDLDRRVSAHQKGVGARYTRSRRPVTLVYSEVAADRSAAQRREMEIKRMPVASKRHLVNRASTRAVIRGD
jgi:putative endonuclease